MCTDKMNTLKNLEDFSLRDVVITDGYYATVSQKDIDFLKTFDILLFTDFFRIYDLFKIFCIRLLDGGGNRGTLNLQIKAN